MDRRNVVMKDGNQTVARSTAIQSHGRGTGGRGTGGFSLLELMLVVAIMGTLMAVVAYNILGSSERAKIRATEATLRTIEGGLTEYHLEYNAWPPDLQTLVKVKPPVIKDGKLADGWSSPVMYEPRALSDDKPFILGSAGPDKIAGNADDIDIWTLNTK